MTTKTATFREKFTYDNVIKKLSDEQEIRLEQFALETLLDVAANAKSDAAQESAARSLLEWRFSKNRRDGSTKSKLKRRK